MNRGAHQTLYDILGIPCGVGVDHIKDSYRLLTKKTPVTDGAYAVLSDPVEKQRYDAELWTAARIERRSEPVCHEGNTPLTPEQERVLKDWRKSKPWRVELPDGTTVRSEDCVAGNPNITVGHPFHTFKLPGDASYLLAIEGWRATKPGTRPLLSSW